jgi:DNA-binding response OmpR family regulator
VRIVIVGGCPSDEESLSRVARAASLSLSCELLRRHEPRELVRQAGHAALEELEPEESQAKPRALVLEALDRLDLAAVALRALRVEARFDAVAMLIAVSPGHVARIDTTMAFDDFLLHPYLPEELYGRLRALEWRRSELDVRQSLEGLVVDRAGHEVHVDGRVVQLTAKEFALLSYLCERRGRVLSREHLLARVWGNRYEGGSRTVDIHVRRLRAKLGSALPLETLRGSGYKLRRLNADALESGLQPPD